jgi:hypothetical protein
LGLDAIKAPPVSAVVFEDHDTITQDIVRFGDAVLDRARPYHESCTVLMSGSYPIAEKPILQYALLHHNREIVVTRFCEHPATGTTFDETLGELDLSGGGFSLPRNCYSPNNLAVGHAV